MGQKTNPIGNRLGIIRGWDSNWYGGRKFEHKIVEDDKIRKYLNARLAKASISKIYIERTLKLLTVTIFTARPGLIIGKAGSEVDKLKEEIKKLTGKEVQINDKTVCALQIPETVKIIEYYAFAQCDSLKAVQMLSREPFEVYEAFSPSTMIYGRTERICSPPNPTSVCWKSSSFRKISVQPLQCLTVLIPQW